MREPDFTLPGYLHRWHLFRSRPKSRWNVYLHHILAPDRGTDLHDHPAWSLSIVLRGWYVEKIGAGIWGTGRRRVNRAGSIRFRPATEPHRITDVSPGGCWTIWIRGGHRRKWGFWVGQSWVPFDEYENLERTP